MKITFVYPRFPAPESRYKVPPLGIAYLASYLRVHISSELELTVIDANAYDLDTEATFQRVKASAPDVVGISLTTPQADSAYDLTRMIKSWDRQVVIVHGGAHPTALPELSLSFGADYCVLGEGEVTFLELVTSLMCQDGAAAHVPGTVSLVKDELAFAPQRSFIEWLDDVPFPAWDLFDLACYNENIHCSADAALPIMGSRGCPYECSFCASPLVWRRQTRFRMPTNVVNEMIYNAEHYGITHFHFYDDNFLLRPQWALEVCRELQGRSLQYKWVCLSRASAINRQREALTLIRFAGCSGFEIGVESGDEVVLKHTHKSQHVGEVHQAIQNIANAGFSYLGIQLMTFNEGETVEGHYRQARFFGELFAPLYGHPIQLSAESQFPFLGQFATPYPGTPFFESARRSGHILAKQWGDYVTTRVNYVPHSLAQASMHLAQPPSAEERAMLEQVSQQRVFGASDRHSGAVTNLAAMLDTFIDMLGRGATLHEVAVALKARCGVEEELAYQFAAVNGVVISQMGILRSLGVSLD